MRVISHPRLGGREFSVISFLLSALVFVAGCAGPQRAAYQSTALTGVTVQSAMRVWKGYVAAGKATNQQIADVQALYTRYQAAYNVAVDVGKATVNAESQSALQTAINVVVEAQADLVRVLHAFLPTAEAAKIGASP